MTKREMIDKYLRSIDKRRVQGDTMEPLMPFLLGDAIYMIYNADIAHLSLRHEAKKARNQWAECYGRFNRPFFKAFTGDESLEVTDLMDDFEEFIGNELTILRGQVMLILGDSIPFDKRYTITSALLCHVLAQCAQHSWGNVYKVAHRTMAGGQVILPTINPDIRGIDRASFILANLLHSEVSQESINPNKCKGVPPAVEGLCRKIYQWLKLQ